MADDPLIAELRSLGAQLAVPPDPDVREKVRARLRARPRRRWRAIAAALAVALIVAVVPATRAAVAHAVAELFNFAGVRVRHGTPAPAVSPSPLPSIRSADLDRARAAVKFPLRVPAKLGVPDRVELADGNRVASLIYQGGAVRLDEFDGELDQVFLKTHWEPGTDWVEIGDHPGIWFPGPHAVAYIDRQGVTHEETSRLAGPVLIWTDGTATYRLEGLPTFDAARDVALSLG